MPLVYPHTQSKMAKAGVIIHTHLQPLRRKPQGHMAGRGERGGTCSSGFQYCWSQANKLAISSTLLHGNICKYSIFQVSPRNLKSFTPRQSPIILSTGTLPSLSAYITFSIHSQIIPLPDTIQTPLYILIRWSYISVIYTQES